MPRPLIVAAVLGSLVITEVAAQDRPAADTVWRFEATSDIKQLRVCNATELMAVTKNSLLALDATTGAKLWEQADLPDLEWGLVTSCDNKTGVSYRENRIVAFDLVSGQRRWDQAALPAFLEIRGYAVLYDLDLLLLFLRTAASDRSLAAVRLSSGERLWQRDDVFAQPVAFAGHGGVSDLAEFQAFVLQGDTGVIVYVSPDGPIHLDLRTGATRWTGQALAGPRVPHVGDYALMRLIDSTLIIPREKGLIALDASNGQVRWQSPTLLPRRATRLLSVPSGVLVRAGADFVTVLDPVTGTPRWAKPLTLRTDGAAYEVVGNRYYLVSHDKLFVTDLATGDTTNLGKLRFKDNEWAAQMISADEGLIVISRQNLFRVDAQGALRYQRYYPAPGASFLQQLGGMSPLSTFGTAAVAEKYGYFVTNMADTAGRKGNSLLRVALDDGSEAGRIWLHEKAPTYWPDTARDQVLMLRDDKTLVALRFPAGRVPGRAP